MLFFVLIRSLAMIIPYVVGAPTPATNNEHTYPLRCNEDALHLEDRMAAIKEIRNFNGLNDQLPATDKEGLPLSKQCGSPWPQCVYVSIRAFESPEIWAPIGTIELAAQRISDECGERGGSVEVEGSTNMVVHMTSKWV